MASTRTARVLPFARRARHAPAPAPSGAGSDPQGLEYAVNFHLKNLQQTRWASRNSPAKPEPSRGEHGEQDAYVGDACSAREVLPNLFGADERVARFPRDVLTHARFLLRG